MDASAGSSPPHSQENPPKRAGGRGKAPAGEIRKGHASAAAADDFMFAEDTFPSLPDFPCLSSPSSSTFSSSSSSNSSTAFAAAGRGRGRAATGSGARDPYEPAAGDDDMLEDIDELLNFATISDSMPWEDEPFPGAASYPMPTPVAVAAPGFGVCPQRMAGTEPSASKEARKKRMARQRRLSALQHQRSQQLNLGQIQSAMIHPQQEAFSAHSAPVTPSSSGGWGGLWPPPAVQLQGQGQLMVQVPNPLSTKSNSSSRKKQQKPSPDAAAQQGAKPAAADKNLRFLLQKVLKQSDVGALGRIVLPKKEAETHLPELKSRDGISIPMEDIGTSQVWSMRYRFWPNNKSRMYLLENTGDFVRMNDLQEGDFIVIYSDVKSGKYLIRGVKVRPMAHDQAKHKHGTYDLNNVGVEDGGATEAGSCKGKSPHRVRRSSQEAASMNQMAVST